VRPQPLEECWDWHQQSAPEPAGWKLASARGVVCGRSPEAKEPGRLLDRERCSARELIDAQLRIVLHVGTSL